MLIIIILYFFFSGFLGYIIGRFGDYYVNFWIRDPYWLPDHWIYGIILMASSLFFFRSWWWLYVFSFGLGHFISDLKDFLNLKFYGSDNKDKSQRRFWHID
jgi:hypothetical protein